MKLLLFLFLTAAVSFGQTAALKVYISVDAVGAGGVTNFADLDPRDADYEMFRRTLTAEVNAAAAGATAAGATEIVVEEQHGRLLRVDEIDPKIQLIRGWPRPRGGATGLDSTFQAAFFIGYHSREGALKSVLPHTFVPEAVADFRINGQSVGEAEYYAIVAGAMGVPVILVTGDDGFVDPMREYLRGAAGVAVKHTLSPTSAIVEPPGITNARIKAAAEDALRRRAQWKPLRVEAPYRAEIAFKPAWDEKIARIVKENPEISQPAPRTLARTCKNVDELIDFEVKLRLRETPPAPRPRAQE